MKAAPHLSALAIALLLPAGAAASGEPPCDALPREAELERAYPRIQAFWDTHVETGSFPTVAPVPEDPDRRYQVNPDIRIRYAVLVHPEPRARVVISNGRTETFLKYKEMATTLWCRGYSVYMLDHRGQGLSSRVLVHDPARRGARRSQGPVEYENRGHVEDFEAYVTDLRTFVRRVVERRGPPAPLVLLAHSMGGGIAARLIERDPTLFRAAVLSSPMLDVPGHRSLPCWLVPLTAWFAGHDAYTVFGKPWIHADRAPYRPGEDFQKAVARHYTSSPTRHDLWHREYAAPVDGVDLRIGSATKGWYRQACQAVERMADDADRVQIPVLVLIAGADTIIPPEGQHRFCERVSRGPGTCQTITIPGARHEMFIERDEIRDEVLGRFERFVEREL